MNEHKLITRIIVTPFAFAIILIAYIAHAVHRTFLFLKYGGEFISFTEHERPTIEDIYNELKAQRK